MDQGCIVERGAFSALMLANGRFAEMWRLQQEERKPESSPAGATGM